ncbi:MAG: hypothetical protein ACK5MR_05095, partial [Cumulibacter sp.]
MTMLDFMVIGLPRSGTTWAAQWLTTAHSFCLHDPLYLCHYSELDSYADRVSIGRKTVGVSCTALWRWPQFVSSHPARKVIIHRDIRDINSSLKLLGFPAMTERDALSLYDLPGLHFQYADLFCESSAAAIWDYLVPGVKFDPARYHIL